MKPLVTSRTTSRRGARRLPAAAAFALAAGIGLAGCAQGQDPEPEETPAAAAPTSSSSTESPPSSASSSSSSTTPAPEPAPPRPPVEPVDPQTDPATAPAGGAAPTSTRLPALVVDAGGPCHTIGDVAQAVDGSPLFCLNDPQAGPLWLPQPETAPGDAGPALLGTPCSAEGLTVTAPEGATLTCGPGGDATVPGGLVWHG